MREEISILTIQRVGSDWSIESKYGLLLKLYWENLCVSKLIAKRGVMLILAHNN